MTAPSWFNNRGTKRVNHRFNAMPQFFFEWRGVKASKVPPTELLNAEDALSKATAVLTMIASRRKTGGPISPDAKLVVQDAWGRIVGVAKLDTSAVGHPHYQ